MAGVGDASSDFTKMLIASATVVGTFVTAAVADLLWVFWLLVLLSLAYAVGRWALPALARYRSERRDLLRLGRDHPRAMRVAAEHQSEADRLKVELAAAQSAADEGRAESIMEGRRRVVGELLAGETDSSLELVALAVEEDNLLLAAKCSSGQQPLVGSRWLLTVKGVSAVYGVCRVRELSPDDHVLLDVVETRDLPSMKALTEQARQSSEAPSSLALRQRSFLSLSDLERES